MELLSPPSFGRFRGVLLGKKVERGVKAAAFLRVKTAQKEAWNRKLTMVAAENIIAADGSAIGAGVYGKKPLKRV